MDLQTFIQRWILNDDRDIIVCDVKYTCGLGEPDMVKHVNDFAIFKFSPKYNGLDISIFVKENLCKASVELFYISDTFAVIWVDLK